MNIVKRMLLPTLVICWILGTLYLGLMQSATIHLQFDSTVTLVWFMGGFALMIAVVAGGDTLIKSEATPPNYYNRLSSYLSEPIVVCTEHGLITWQNEASKPLFPPDVTITGRFKNILERSARTKRVAMQVLALDEQNRYSAQVIPLEDDTFALVLRQVHQQDNPMYDHFIRRIVHDMRNPLAGIIGHAMNLQHIESTERDTWMQSAETIEKEAQRLAKLVDSMLFDARLAYMPLDIQCLDLMDIVEESFFAHEENAFKSGKSIEIEAPQERLMIEGDRDLLVRAFGNLIDNSMKYSDEDGHLTIRVESYKNRCIIYFQDNGDGIPEKYLPDRIFEPLVRGRSTGSGSGLGLSIVKKIIEMHHGQIKAENRLPKGATMTVTLLKASESCNPS